MTDKDLYFEIPEERPSAPPVPVVETPPPAAAPPAPEPEPARAPPAARPLPPSAAPAPARERNRRLTLALAALGAVLVVAIIAVLTFSVTIGPSTNATSYPYTVTYDVVFPNAIPVQVGNIAIVAIPYPDRVSLSVDKVPYDIPLGEKRQITAKHATVTLLGLPLLSFDFTLEVEYRGMTGNDASFGLAVRTSDQIPKFMIDRLLPRDVQARPA